MSRIDVIMPQMGESIAEGTLSKWLKKVGDTVKRDEPIFEISTDKVDAEIPAPNAGVLTEIIVNEGQTVEVQTVVARIETDASVAASIAPTEKLGGSGGGAPAGPFTASSETAQGAGSEVSESPETRSGSGASHAVTGPAGGSTPLPAGKNGSFEERLKTKSSPLVRK